MTDYKLGEQGANTIPKHGLLMAIKDKITRLLPDGSQQTLGPHQPEEYSGRDRDEGTIVQLCENCGQDLYGEQTLYCPGTMDNPLEYSKYMGYE